MMPINRKTPIRWVHSPFSFDYQNVKVSCDRDGRVTIRVDGKDDEYDEVVIPTTVIYKTSYLLKSGRKSVPFIKENK